MDSLRGERNASAHTLRAYRNELDRFAEYMGPEAQWKEIDHITVRGFLSHLHGSGLSKVSVARALAALRSMYKWLGREGIVAQNPAKLVSSPKLPKRLPRVPTMEEINGLLNTDMPETAAFPERDRAIFELLYGCGLRNSELVGVELGDIEEANGVILVRGKGKKQRYVPLEGAAAEALAAYREAQKEGAERNAQEYATAVHQSAGWASDDTQRGADREKDCRSPRSAAGHPSAYAAPRLWHAYADGRRRPAGHPGVAGT